MKTVTSTEAKAKLNALLAEVERTGLPVTITNHGRAVAVLSPAHRRPRRFGQLRALVVREFRRTASRSRNRCVGRRFMTARRPSSTPRAVLLDTNALLWLVSAPERVSDSARQLRLGDPDTNIMVSAASAWDILINTRWRSAGPGAAVVGVVGHRCRHDRYRLGDPRG